MTKTQVQLPDDLYRDTKAIAKKYEMSFAEVVRRGLEHMRLHYPLGKKSNKRWEPPKPRSLGWKGLSADELKDAAQMTSFEEDVNRRSPQR